MVTLQNSSRLLGLLWVMILPMLYPISFFMVIFSRLLTQLLLLSFLNPLQLPPALIIGLFSAATSPIESLLSSLLISWKCAYLILLVPTSLPLLKVEELLTIFSWLRSCLLVTIKGRGVPKCAIKVDLRKSFDSVRRDVLLAMSTTLNTPASFLNCIASCITSPRFSLNINGSLEGFFADLMALDKEILFLLIYLL